MSAVWPYLVVIGAGFLPNEAFRVAAVLLGRGLDERSAVFAWIRLVAVALLAAVVSKLATAPAAALAAAPPWAPVAAIATGVAVYFGLRRRLLAGILLGEATLIGAIYAFA